MPDSGTNVDGDTRGILDPGRFRTHVDFRRHDPGVRLAGFVDWFWSVTWDQPEGEEFVQEVLTHPTANVSVGSVSSRGLAGDEVDATVVGVRQSVDRRRLRGRGWNVAAKLKPGALGAFCTVSAAALTNRVTIVGAAMALDGAALVDSLVARADDVSGQVALLESALAGVLADARPPRLEAAAEAVRVGVLLEGEPIRSVAELSKRSGHSTRALQRLFREHAGVSPLWMLRRYRLIDAAEAARSDQPASWAHLAADLGYADQSHLIRDFKATLGRTPAAYADDITPLSGSWPYPAVPKVAPDGC